MTRDELRVAVLQALKKTNNVAIQAAPGIGKSTVPVLSAPPDDHP